MKMYSGYKDRRGQAGSDGSQQSPTVQWCGHERAALRLSRWRQLVKSQPASSVSCTVLECEHCGAALCQSTTLDTGGDGVKPSPGVLQLCPEWCQSEEGFIDPEQAQLHGVQLQDLT